MVRAVFLGQIGAGEKFLPVPFGRKARTASPADATPSGNLMPSYKTCDRIGKLPSSRIRQTVSSPRRTEKKALSPVSRASRWTVGRAISVTS